MKKILACVLMLAMFLSLGLVGGWNGRALADTPEDRVGTYELVELYIDGEDYTELLGPGGFVFTLTLYADRTANLVMDDESMEFTWDEEYFDYGDSKSPYSFENGILTLEEDGMVMIFKLAGSAAEKVEESEEPVDITGTWVGIVDMRDFVVESAPDMDGYLNSAPVAITMEMRDDGTYTLIIDATTAIPAVTEALRSYVEATCAENGLTQAEFEAAIGMTIDEFLEEAVSQMDLEGAVQTVTGEYVEEDGKVTWDPGAEETRGIFTGSILTFSVEGFGDTVLSRGELTGTWIAAVDMKDILVEEEPELEPYLENAKMYVVLELKADGGFEMTFDGTSLLPVFREAMRTYIVAMCEENDITLEEFEAAAGMDLETALDEMVGEMDVADVTEKVSGRYTENNGKLELKADGDTVTGSFNGMTVTLGAEYYGQIVFTRAGFLGTWGGTVDMTELLTEDDPEMAEYLQDLKMGITVELKADGSYTVSVDARAMISGLKAGMRAYLADMAEESGMTLEQLEEALGMSVDEFLDTIVDEMNTDDLLATEEGSYTVKNGRVVFDGEENTLMGGVWSGSTMIFTLEDFGDIVLTRR